MSVDAGRYVDYTCSTRPTPTITKDPTMDNFTCGMFGELSSYEDRMEFEAWLEATEGVGEAVPSEEGWVEPFDWTDILQRHRDDADALEREEEAERQEALAEAEWCCRWEAYYAQWE